MIKGSDQRSVISDQGAVVRLVSLAYLQDAEITNKKPINNN